MTGSPRPRAWLWLVVVLGVWAVVFLPRLGSAGFTNTEAHRAVPAFELIAKQQAGTVGWSDWIAPTMFERVYLRKPPGMTWAVAVSASVFGSTEFSSRLVSALSVLIAALVSGLCARRWFGDGARLPAALAVVLMPAVWLYGRTAELEAPMFAGTLIASLYLLDLLMMPKGGRRWMAVLGGALGGSAMLLVKGPAGLPAVGGALVASVLLSRSVRVLVDWRLLIALAGPGLLFAGWVVLAARAASGDDAITQSPGAFLWSLDRALDVAALAPMALLAGLPMSLVLLFPWGPDAAAEPLGQDERARRMSRALAAATLATLGLFVALGVSNPRYALPALVFTPPLVGWAVNGLGRMTASRARIARWMMLGGPSTVAAALLIAGVVYSVAIEPRVRTESGRQAGREIAALVPAGSEVAADHAIEARPEVLLELVRAGAVVRWMGTGTHWPTGAHMLARDDERSREADAHSGGSGHRKRATLGRWRVHEYEVVLLGPER